MADAAPSRSTDKDHERLTVLEKKLAELLEQVATPEEAGPRREALSRVTERPRERGPGRASRPALLVSPQASIAVAGPHPADQALEVIALQAGRRDRMVRRLAALLEDLDRPPRVLGDLAEHVGERPPVDQARAGAGGEDPVGLEDARSPRG